MSHNKIYREIPGYEDALYKTSEAIDEMNELHHEISDGKKPELLIDRIIDIEKMIADIRKLIS